MFAAERKGLTLLEGQTMLSKLVDAQMKIEVEITLSSNFSAMVIEGYEKKMQEIENGDNKRKKG